MITQEFRKFPIVLAAWTVRAIIRIEVMGSFLASSVEAPEAELVIAHFSLILHTQEKFEQRDKLSSLFGNPRSGKRPAANLNRDQIESEVNVRCL